MNMISMLGFRDNLATPMGMDPEAIMVLERNNTVRFIERLRGQSTVLVISSPAGAEAVEVYSPDGFRLVTVQRGVDDSPILAHPAGACVEFHGLPINPCVTATAICESEDAIATLRRCLIEATPIDLQALIRGISEVPQLRAELAMAAADGICDNATVRARMIECIGRAS